MSRFRRVSLGSGSGYVPGEQPASDDEWVKLNTNEAPLAPSPRVAAAVRDAAAALRLYPDPFGEPLRSALARHHSVEPDQIFVANGGDQVIDCCYRAFAEPGSTVLHPVPTYTLFPVLARVFSVRDLSMPLQRDGALHAGFASVPAVLRFVVNPNSPTGQWIAPDRLERQLDGAAGVVVIDEAYCDFAPDSCVSRLTSHDNWIVLRSFSKSHALAGLRVGYAVASRELVADLHAVQDSYPVDRCALAGALAALQDAGYHQRLVATVREQRTRLVDALCALGWDVLPSEANFVFARPPEDRSAKDVARKLRDQRILVRHLDAPPVDGRLRITVGDAVSLDRLLRAVQRLGVATG